MVNDWFAENHINDCFEVIMEILNLGLKRFKKSIYKHHLEAVNEVK